MAEESKGVSLVILGIVAVLAIVGLVLLFSKAGSTGYVVSGNGDSYGSSDSSITGEFKIKAPKIKIPTMNQILGKKTTGGQTPVLTPSPAPVSSNFGRLVRCVNGADVFESVQDTDKCEVSGQRFVRPLGYIFKNQESGTVLLQRCLVGGREAMPSTDPNCEGQQKVGPLGYVYTSAQPNTGPLYRCYTGKDHFLFLQSNCEGARKEGVVGYILQSPVEKEVFLVVGDSSPASDVLTIADISKQSNLLKSGYSYNTKLDSEVSRLHLAGRVTVVVDNGRALIIVGSQSPAEQVVIARNINDYFISKAIAKGSQIPLKMVLDTEIKSDDLVSEINRLLPCTETDGGKDYYVFGETQGVSQTNGVFYSGQDVCGSSNNPYAGVGQLVEHYCDGIYHTNEVVTCPKGCKDDACIK